MVSSVIYMAMRDYLGIAIPAQMGARLHHSFKTRSETVCGAGLRRDEAIQVSFSEA